MLASSITQGNTEDEQPSLKSCAPVLQVVKPAQLSQRKAAAG
jgi:hypothetical protein